MSDSLLHFAFAILGGVAAGSAAWATMRQQSKRNREDTNGLGRKYGRLIALLIRWADTEEKRNQLADTVDPSK